MLKLDTHSIQMIAVCTILISTIFLGYLEFKRLHYKLDSISNNLKTIEDSKTINKGLKNVSNSNEFNMTNPPIKRNIQVSTEEVLKNRESKNDLNKDLSKNGESKNVLNKDLSKNVESKEQSYDKEGNLRMTSGNLVNEIFSSNKPIDQSKIINHVEKSTSKSNKDIVVKKEGGEDTKVEEDRRSDEEDRRSVEEDRRSVEEDRRSENDEYSDGDYTDEYTDEEDKDNKEKGNNDENYEELDDKFVDNLDNMDFLEDNDDEEAVLNDDDDDDNNDNDNDNDNDNNNASDDKLEISLNNELNNKKLKELRGILKERNLPVTGSKTECINRIVKDMNKK